MTHREFRLTVKNEILENAGYDRKAVPVTVEYSVRKLGQRKNK